MKNLNKIKNKLRASFTLIEVVTALAILAVGLMSVLALFPVGFQASGRAQSFIKATLFAQEKLEEIKMKGYDAAVDEDEDVEGNTEGKFKRTVHVEDVEGFEDYLREVIVAVKWPKPGEDKEYEKEFKTYIADYTP